MYYKRLICLAIECTKIKERKHLIAQKLEFLVNTNTVFGYFTKKTFQVEKEFRSLNLDISCPAQLPVVSSCSCLLKNKDGIVIKRMSGINRDYQI
jgi:hypothetical protein